MNHWKIIFNCYERATKWHKFLIGAFLNAHILEKILFASLVLIFGISMHEHISNRSWGFYVLCISAVVLSYMINRMKQNYVFSSFGDPEFSQAPPDGKRYKESRYMQFKRMLEDNHIDKSVVDECLPLADMQIGMASTEGLLGKKLFSLLIGISLGFWAAVLRQLDENGLVAMGVAIFLIGSMLMLFISIIPSKIENMKEMKYFMMLYCREEKYLV